MAVFFDIFTLYSPHDDMFRCSDPPCGVLKTELDEFERMSLLARVRPSLIPLYGAPFLQRAEKMTSWPLGTKQS